VPHSFFCAHATDEPPFSILSPPSLITLFFRALGDFEPFYLLDRNPVWVRAGAIEKEKQ
jgi:hypothetical protein